VSQTHIDLNTGSPPATPRWVKVLGMIVIGVIIIVAIGVLSGHLNLGEHGPGRHMPSSHTSDDAPSVEQEVQPEGAGDHTMTMEHGGEHP
jgi:hypothetical protein